MCPPMSRESHGQPSLTSTMPNGRFHQWADWSNTFRHLLSNHHLFIRHIRYVDNRLIFGDKRLTELAPYEVLLDDGFYGKPIILETEPDQEFLGFMLETKPLELIYQGPTNISQVLSPFSASPPAVLLSGFRPRCHIVIKGAFPASRVQQGLTQLIHLYIRAGFPKEELQTISDQLLIQHQNFPSQCQTRASRLHAHVLIWFPRLFWIFFFCLFFPWLCLLPLSSCCVAFPCAHFGSFLAQPSLAPSFLWWYSSWWITLKLAPSITTWLGLWCIWTIWRGSFPFSSPPLNGRTLCLLKIFVLKTWDHEACTPSFLYLHRQRHQHW